MRMNWYQWLFRERERTRERRLFLYSRRFFSRVIMSITITFLLLLLLFFSSLFLRCLRLYCHRLWRMSSLGDERRSKYECTRQSNKFQDRRTEKDEHIDEKQDMTGEKKKTPTESRWMSSKSISFRHQSFFVRFVFFWIIIINRNISHVKEKQRWDAFTSTKANLNQPWKRITILSLWIYYQLVVSFHKDRTRERKQLMFISSNDHIEVWENQF